MTRPQGRPRALTDDQVFQIRLEYSSREATQSALAKRYHVHPQTIYNVIHGKGPYRPPDAVLIDKDGQDYGSPQRGPGID